MDRYVRDLEDTNIYNIYNTRKKIRCLISRKSPSWSLYRQKKVLNILVRHFNIDNEKRKLMISGGKMKQRRVRK